jgi:hypothetical protein
MRPTLSPVLPVCRRLYRAAKLILNGLFEQQTPLDQSATSDSAPSPTSGLGMDISTRGLGMDRSATRPPAAVGHPGTRPAKLHPQVPSRPFQPSRNVVQPPPLPSTPPTFVEPLRCSSAKRLCAANQSKRPLRRWADPWPRRVGDLQRTAPPVWDSVNERSTHRLLFIHIPKCAGSTFRNGAPYQEGCIECQIPTRVGSLNGAPYPKCNAPSPLFGTVRHASNWACPPRRPAEDLASSIAHTARCLPVSFLP